MPRQFIPYSPDEALVSVIIPAYNAEKTISNAIESVLNQTWKHLELIVINDGSSDKTEEIVLQYMHDERIKYFHQENKGCSSAKNTGLKVAAGAYIQYLDADDLLSTTKIEVQIEALRNNKGSLAVCRTIKFKEFPVENEENEIDSSFLYSTTRPIEFLLNLYGFYGSPGMIQPNAFMLSREISDRAGIWDESISPSPDEDGEYFCRVILASSSIIFTPLPVNYYRIGIDNSLSKQPSHIHAKGALNSIIKKKGSLLLHQDSESVRFVIAKQFSEFEYRYFNLYPDLIKLADIELMKIGFQHKVPITGGKRFKVLATIVGMKNALKIRKGFQLFLLNNTVNSAQR